MCAAYCAANSTANDEDEDDDDRSDPPSRAIPWPLRDSGRGTILKLPVLAGEGHSARAVAFCKWLLVGRCGLWRGGRVAIAAFVQQIYVVALLSNGERKVRKRRRDEDDGPDSGAMGKWGNVPVFLPVLGQEHWTRENGHRPRYCFDRTLVKL